MMILLSIVAKAYDFESDGLYFNILSSTEKTVEITSGSETYKVGEITLPSSVSYKNVEFSVVGIGDNAFNSATFDGITIPASIKTIGNRAFAYSSYYNRPYYICFEGKISINSEAFWCSWYGTFIFINNEPPTLIDGSDRGYLFNTNPIMCIPDGANDNSFKKFASRGSVIHYESSIDASVLKSLALSQFLVNSDDYEYEITSLTKPYSAKLKSVKKSDAYISLPASVSFSNYNFLVRNTCENLFSNAENLEELIIPEGYISMDGSIGICNSLKKVIIPSTIKILSKTFENCPNLEHVESNIQNPFETDAFNTNIISLFTTLYVPDNSIEYYKSTSPWNLFQSILPLSNLTKYKITYMIGDEVYKEQEYQYGTTIIPEPAPTKNGYTFSGWSEIPETMPAHDVTVTGSFIVNKYKLIYKVDGEEYKSYEIDYGASITPEAEPTKEGYTFSGWSEIPETMPAHDITVTGTFSINKYKLAYTIDGEEYKSYELDYGASITPEAAPTKEGYTFSGWSKIPETMPAHDVTVTGTFTINKYKLTYIVDGQTYKTYDVEYGAAITPEPAPTKEGYTFSGWSEIPEIMPSYDVTVTGTFTKGAYILTYMVDGKEYKTVSYDYGDAITPEPAPTKEGYTFSGWSEIPATMPAHDVTITGTFTINKYKLMYMVDGAEYKSYEVEYGATITPETEPTKEGYTFNGWSEIPETMPAHDVTVTGTFSINSYKLTYMIDDKVYKEAMYEYGATITPEPQPEDDYATFEWIDLPQTMPAHDVVVYASYTSGIVELQVTRRQNVRIYSPNGKRLNTFQKGVNIIRMNDGKTKKIVVK